MKRTLLLLMILCCTACAEPKVQPYNLNRQSPVLEKDALLTSDRVRLPVRSWLPQGAPKAVVIGLHGMNDYSNAIKLPGEYLAQNDIAVYAYDQRGFGASPNIGIWPGEDNLVSDLGDMMLTVKKKYPGVPLYILGESMGAAVAIAAFSRKDNFPVDGIILSAPAVWGGAGMNPFYRATLWVISHTAPDKIFTGEGLRIQATDNIALLRELGKDPLVQKGTRADTVLGLVRLMGSGYEKLKELHVPLLILYGDKDQVIPRSSVEGAIAGVKAHHQFGLYPSGYHMLLRDLGRAIPTQDVASWILEDKKQLHSGLYWSIAKITPNECKVNLTISKNLNSAAIVK
jgi:alpha-beta hydrolase superfamily lysophospholipase